MRFASFFFLLGALTFVSCATSSTPSNNDSMNAAPQAVIAAFADAIATNDAAALEAILHPNFTVIIPRYPTADKNSVLDRDTYIQLIGSKKIGGERYTVTYDQTTVIDYNANLMVTFDGPNTIMQATFLLTEVSEGDWQIVVDYPILRNK
ncbi:nuclear transport factor 2 family protein [Lewinella sp. 4G2]|uniref:nuclear transport factor 2 family protein n=1 Tax=Lewinella sp. 4G2 TaxID=1803372 RepID=UPI0007B4A788|nr:nuclear transport factor 2 family protein [Lewinella sp. 4G2]OAV45181.1 hypothetical protein A3850_012060 [Lewinella sp. 4G2]